MSVLGLFGGEEHQIPFEAKATAKKSETHFSLSLSLSAPLATPTLLLSPETLLLWPFSLSLSPPPSLSLHLVSRRMLHNVSGVEEKFMDANSM